MLRHPGHAPGPDVSGWLIKTLVCALGRARIPTNVEGGHVRNTRISSARLIKGLVPTILRNRHASRPYNPRTMSLPSPEAAPPARVARLSYFFPAHNEEANLEGLVEEALATLPTLADTFEIIAVDDGSSDATPQIADRLAAADPDIVRVVHHPTNLGYGAALRSGFAAARYELVAFTDGDRQFRVVDLGRLTNRLAQPDRPDVVVGFRIKRADPPVRIAYARAYRLANRIFFGLEITDVDCAAKLFRREALEGLRVESGGAFFSAETIVKLRAAGRTVVEVGIPHYPRTAGSATGANPRVVVRAMRDFWLLRLRMWADRTRALRRGEPIVRAEHLTLT